MKIGPRSTDGKVRFLHPDFSLQQRVAEAAAVVADPRRGKVVELARRHGVSRQTASALVGKVRRACADVLAPRAPGRASRTETVVVDRERIAESVVALAVEAHASNAGTQACLQTMLGQHVATGRISALLKDASRRARERLQTPAAVARRSLDPTVGPPPPVARNPSHHGPPPAEYVDQATTAPRPAAECIVMPCQASPPGLAFVRHSTRAEGATNQAAISGGPDSDSTLCTAAYTILIGQAQGPLSKSSRFRSARRH